MKILKNSNGKYNLLYERTKKKYLCSSGGNVLEFSTRLEADELLKSLKRIIEGAVNVS